jgi:collagen type VII alpha
MRRHLNYANVVATFALLFAMSGGALAAKHYLINSTKQINPKVLKKLKGNAGKTGKTGATGPAGAAGSQGKEGPQGIAGSAVAYAHILGLTAPGNPLDGGNSKNVSSVTEVGTGAYCISTTVPIKNVSGVPDFTHGGAVGVTVSANFDLVPGTITSKVCPAGTTVLAETGTGGTTKSVDFWISFN